jgi:hypothetical protein
VTFRERRMVCAMLANYSYIEEKRDECFELG